MDANKAGSVAKHSRKLITYLCGSRDSNLGCENKDKKNPTLRLDNVGSPDPKFVKGLVMSDDPIGDEAPFG